MNEQLPISEASPIIARFFDYKHFTYPWHFHSEYEVMLVKEGYGKRFVGNRIATFVAGDVILFGSSLPHYMKSDEVFHALDNSLRVKGTIVQFEKDFMHYSINHYPQFIKVKKLLEEAQQGIYFPAGCSKQLVKLLDALPNETGIDQITSLLQLLKEMSEITTRQVISTTDYANAPILDMARIDKIISYLNKNYTKHIELAEVASLAAMNPSAFCRFFKSKTSKSLTKYILDMRISHACKLLVLDDMSIVQISTECGFDTISYFNKVFKKTTGYTPTQYKQIML
ncbi:AraC family transcriptional regulator [Bacteroides sp. 214]|uniref:AraC family transcriptional regulator n=1 Tax=Bacteroides sp. 214 TaxID=2302935 RepID=UPI0013D1FD84|nr:AraC family transcriptional regulator [Bacteroides sp. 214]NDW13434.1 AraC family transcriptional regulator [Bacteroides sp. 214]